MKNLKLLLATTAMLSTGAFVANVSADPAPDSSITLNVSAEISHVASLSKIADLSFGHIAVLPNAEGDVVVGNDGDGWYSENALFASDPVSGGVAYTNYNTASEDDDPSGSGANLLEPSFTFTYDNVSDGNGHELTTEIFAGAKAGYGWYEDGLDVVGRLRFPANTPSGTYTGEVTVSIIYAR